MERASFEYWLAEQWPKRDGGGVSPTDTNQPAEITPLASSASICTQASPPQIREAMEKIYCHAEHSRMKPPNVKELARFVNELLASSGKKASRSQIEKEAKDFANRRRKCGQRVNGSFPPFSLEGLGKSGSES